MADDRALAPRRLHGRLALGHGGDGFRWVVLLSLPLGTLRDHYGTYDPVVLWSPRASARQRHRQRVWGPGHRGQGHHDGHGAAHAH